MADVSLARTANIFRAQENEFFCNIMQNTIFAEKLIFLCSEDVGRSDQRNVSHNTIQAYTIFVLHFTGRTSSS